MQALELRLVRRHVSEQWTSISEEIKPVVITIIELLLSDVELTFLQ